jgi:tetratricopeptide (TPR) repeat protein
MMSHSDETCDNQTIQAILATAARSSEEGLTAIDGALAEHPGDARLHFLKGSLLIGAKRLVLAHKALSRAVELAPDFHIARFQLGFFELTSGEAQAARETWAPLHVLPDGHWMRLFIDGLKSLAADRFEACIDLLRQGIAANTENLPLNNDMRLIIERCEQHLGGAWQGSQTESDEALSATSLLLGQRRAH